MKKHVFSCLLMVSMIISLLHINIYAEETINNNDQTTQAFDNLTRLTPELVQSLIDELNNQAKPSARLTEDDILFEREIFTTDNSRLRALTLRPLTQYEINECLEELNTYCQTMTILYENEEDRIPTSSYNCHYYAWCRDWCDEEYWINSAEPIVYDKHTTTFTNEEYVQIGDIVTYWVNGECKHSAIVYSFINGQIFCKSKWGENGLFIHPIDDVPPEYKNNGQKNVKFHRYDHGIHFWGWNKVSDTQHEWKCNGCSTTTNAQANHTFEYTGGYNSNGHLTLCHDCGYSFYEDHNLYMYQDNGEDGCIVKCNDCAYVIDCPEAPEYNPAGDSGHNISCPGGEFSFFAEHDNRCTMIMNNLYYHNVVCLDCGYSCQESHAWELVSGVYRCTYCGITASYVPDIMSLSDEEIEAYIASLSDEELEEFIASLPEDQAARVTALLPGDDDELLTE